MQEQSKICFILTNEHNQYLSIFTSDKIAYYFTNNIFHDYVLKYDQDDFENQMSNIEFLERQTNTKLKPLKIKVIFKILQ